MYVSKTFLIILKIPLKIDINLIVFDINLIVFDINLIVFDINLKHTPHKYEPTEND